MSNGQPWSQALPGSPGQGPRPGDMRYICIFRVLLIGAGFGEADRAATPEGRPRLERGTYCLGGTFEACLDDATCGLTCRSVITRIARGGLRLPCACGRWLPVWLPGSSLAALMFERSRPEVACGSSRSSSDSTRPSAARAMSLPGAVPGTAGGRVQKPAAIRAIQVSAATMRRGQRTDVAV